MPPLAHSYNNVLHRTVRNLEQAQGVVRRRATVAELLQTHASEETNLSNPPPESASMANDAQSLASSADADTDTSPTPAVPAPINLTADLTASTALLQNLRTRNSILAADLGRITTTLTSCEQIAAKALSDESRSRTRWMFAAAGMFGVWVAYLWWCWYMRVEFEYMRKRRGEVFGV